MLTIAMTITERVAGSLLAGALGDAWGGPYEGCRGEVEFYPPNVLELTDDTQLTLATCEAILESGVDPETIARAFTRWHAGGRLTGLGRSTIKALRDLDAGVHWAAAGAKGERAAGNGPAMRIAPLAFLLDPAEDEDRVLIRDVCRITHHHDEAYAGALAVVAAIRCAMRDTPETYLEAAERALPDCGVRDRIRELAERGLSPMEAAQRYGRSGYAVESVPLALLCAERGRSKTIARTLTETIELGGDTDTIASMAGQVAGAAAGRSALPWRGALPGEEMKQAAQVVELFARYVAG